MRPDIQPTLGNALVSIRPLRATDFDALYAVAADPLIWQQHPNHDRWTRPVFEHFFRAAMDSGGAMLIADARTNAVIGSSRFQVLPGVQDGIEIGWTFLARSYWGGPYNRAVKQLMIDHILQEVQAVVFYVHRTNWRSRNAMEKLGALLITAPAYPHLRNTDPEKCSYLITRETWPSHTRA